MGEALGKESEIGVLADDFNGRLTKAFDGHARFNRWGKHFILSLTRSHQLMQATNFMD
jgi:hypothetical protein